MRRWWAVDAAVAALVLLALLVARDAYVSIGWTLLLVTLAALVTIVRAVRPGVSRSACELRGIGTLPGGTGR